MTRKTAREKPILMDRSKIEKTIESLNKLSIWNNEIQFTSADFKGHALVWTTTENIRIRLPFAEMFCFSKGQTIIAATTGIAIPRPPHGQVIDEWQDAIIISLAIARQKGMPQSAGSLKEQTRHDLLMAWQAANQPTAKNNEDFIEFVRTVKRSRRNIAGICPQTDPLTPPLIPPVVFTFEGFTLVHVPTVIVWLSIPSVADRRVPAHEIQDGLTDLEFVYRENFTRGYDGDSESACLWQGPLDVLD